MEKLKLTNLGGIGLEVVRGCNFRCRMCPSSLACGDSMRFMTLETAELIVERLNETDQIGALWCFGLGEALAHPDIYNLYSIFNKIKRSKETPVILHTNASLLYGEAAYSLVELPFVSQLYISFDGYGTEESFRSLRGNHFQEVIDRTRDFTLLAKRKRPGMYIGTCSIYPEPEYLDNSVKKYSFDEAEANLKQIFEPMGVHVSMRRLHKYNGYYVPKLFEGKHMPQLNVIGGCRYLEENSFSISYSAKVKPCRDVINEDFTIGDLSKESFSDILQGNKYRELRHCLRMDKREAYNECKNCDKFSFGDDIEGAADFWRKKIDEGSIDNLEELKYFQELIRRASK